VILDDRADVWMVEEQIEKKNGERVTKQTVCKNLIQIPAYFYHDSQSDGKLSFYRQLLRQIGRKWDLDLCLPFYGELLERIHASFY